MPKSRSKPRERKKITVLLDPAEAQRFDAYCADRGFKKSTLIARLIREHLDLQEDLVVSPSAKSKTTR